MEETIRGNTVSKDIKKKLRVVAPSYFGFKLIPAVAGPVNV